MATIDKLLRNTTASNIFIPDTGVSLLANSTYNITEPELLLWVASLAVLPYIISGDIVVNDGILDYSSADGIRALQYPDRLTVQKDGVGVTRVAEEINFTGNVSVVDNGDGKATVAVGSTELLREVTIQIHPFGNINIESNLLFEADIVNDTVRLLTEETI
jgi:hypothetical protein